MFSNDYALESTNVIGDLLLPVGIVVIVSVALRELIVTMLILFSLALLVTLPCSPLCMAFGTMTG